METAEFSLKAKPVESELAGGRDPGWGLRWGNHTCLASALQGSALLTRNLLFSVFTKSSFPIDDPPPELSRPSEPGPDSPEERESIIPVIRLYNMGWQKPKRDHFCHTRGGTEPQGLSGLKDVCVCVCVCVCGKEGGRLGHDAPEMGTPTPTPSPPHLVLGQESWLGPGN